MVRLSGKLPLDGILIFLGSVAKAAKISRQSDGAISSVLPINETDFGRMLMRFQNQTNMKVRLERPKWTISKFAEEGTASPFMNRLFLGILRLRDVIFTTEEIRKEFDLSFQFVLETLMTARTLSEEIKQTLVEHNARVSRGEIARSKQGIIHVEVNIDKKLQKQVDGFLNTAVRVIKDAMQNLLNHLHLDIGFLYGKQGAFERGILYLEKDRPEFAAYLAESRKWTEALILRRNSLHEGWMLPQMKYYEISLGKIQCIEPEIEGLTLSEFIDQMLDRVCCFVEEITTYGFQSQMPPGTSITEIPPVDRNADFPERFQTTFVEGGRPIWKIDYHASRFEDS